MNDTNDQSHGTFPESSPPDERPYTGQQSEPEVEEVPEPPKRSRKPSSPRELPEEERETLAKIIESLGGVAVGRIRLSVQRFTKGVGWRTLRSIQIDAASVENGLDPAELIGEVYGDGTYKWQLRYGGKYLRRGDANVEGFSDVNDENLPPPDNEDYQPVDISQVLSDFKKELREELRSSQQPPAPPPVNLGEAVRTAVESAIRAIEPRAKGPDPTLAAILSLLGQQNTTLMQTLVQQNRPDMVSMMKESFGAMRDVFETAKSMVSPQQVIYEQDEPEDDIPEPAESVPANTPSGFLDGLKNIFEGSASRIATDLMAIGEQKIVTGASSVLGGTQPASPAPAAPPAAPPVGDPKQMAELLDALMGSVTQCIENKRPPQLLADSIVANAPGNLLGTVAVLTTDHIVEAAIQCGRPTIAEAFKKPDYRAFFEQVVQLVRSHTAKAAVPN